MRPTIVSQIFLADGPDQQLSPFLKEATSTIDAVFRGCEHTIYGKETLRAFIAEHYDKEVLWAYDKLRPYSYKANLGRYCLLHTVGGWYFDIAIRVVSDFEIDPDVELLAFRDIQRFSRTSWACATSALYTKRGNSVFCRAIEYVVRNCKTEYYGVTPLCVSGPSLLGEALAAHRGDKRHVFGDCLELTPNHERKNRAFVSPNGTILAWGKPAGGGDLTKLGAKGVNNYNDFWHKRKVYQPGWPPLANRADLLSVATERLGLATLTNWFRQPVGWAGLFVG